MRSKVWALVIGLMVMSTFAFATPAQGSKRVAKIKSGWVGNPVVNPDKGTGYMNYAYWGAPAYYTWARPEKAVLFKTWEFSGEPPVTIDTILIQFYEGSSHPWPDSTVHIVIYGSDGSTVLYTSPDFYALRYPDMTTFVPDTPITINDWHYYVSIVTQDTSGFPSILADNQPQHHSFWGTAGNWNEFVDGEFFIAVHASWADLQHDVQLGEIFTPSGTVATGDTIIPSVEVLNNGVNDETYTVTINIYDDTKALVYSDTMTTSITALSYDSVGFSPWVVGPIGNYSVEAHVYLPGDEVSENDTLTYQFVVSYPLTLISDFETDNGGLDPDPATGGWEWGTPSVGPAYAYSGTNLWGTVLADSYPNNADFFLTSPSFVAIDTIQQIAFYQWYNMENSWDGGNVSISTDGGNTWQLIWPDGGYPDSSVSALGEPGFTGVDTTWNLTTFTLYLPVGTVFKVRWHFASDVSVNRPGWYIDDLMGYGIERLITDHDVGVTEIAYTSPLIAGTPFDVSVKVVNYGGLNDTFDLNFSIYDHEGSLVYTSMTSDVAIGPYDTVQISYPGITLNSGGVYTFEAYSMVSQDPNPSNDTLTESVPVLSFLNDFENDNGGLVADPSDGWEWGTPVVGPSSAYSGEKLWGTVLADSYPDLADFYLTSPDYITTGDVQAITFYQWYSLENGYDGGNVSISTDGGNTWQIIEPEGGYPDNYVNALRGPGFTGYDTTWNPVTFNLNLPAGTIFKIRWHFASDGSVHRLGWYIDDFGGIGFEQFILEHDVQPVDFVVDSSILPNIPFDFGVEVTNNGLYSESFDLSLLIQSIAGDTVFQGVQTVTDLAPGETLEVTFGPITVYEYGAYTATAVTHLTGDQIPSNDTLVESGSVRPPVGGDHVGGPDTYGYYFIDSDAPGGPTFNWIEPTDSTANVFFKGQDKSDKNGSVKDWDDRYFVVPLPFPFNFYGQNYDTVYASTNGILTFGTSTTALSNRSIPSTSLPNNFIAPFWDDLRFYENDSARLDTVSGVTSDGVRYFVIEYENVAHYGCAGEVTDFEVILYENGDILIQYGTLTDSSDYTHGESATVGIEGPNGETGLQYIYNGDPFLLHEGLAVLFSTRLRPYYHDVALESILVPADGSHYIAGETITPVVRVKNTGFYPEPDTFEVSISITHAKSKPVTFSKTVILMPGDSIDVSLPDYTIPAVGGDYVAVATVSLPGDADPSNDTAVATFTAEERDAKVACIVSPQDTILTGTSIEPVVKVTNEGTSVDTFNVTVQIPSAGYDETNTVEAGPGDTIAVTFPAVLLDQPGINSVIAYTTLEYDVNAANDTLESEFFVSYPDAGVDSIINPMPITYSEGDTFTPVVRVVNYGNVDVTTPVIVEVWRSYAKSRTLVYADTAEATVSTGTYVDVTMSRTFTLQDSGYYEVDAYTMLENDMDASNDTANLFFSSYLFRDVGVEDIVAPADQHNIWERVIPEAVFRNYGTAEATFTAKLKVFYEGVLVAVDSVVDVTIPASGASNVQFTEYQFNASGNYTFKFCAIYPEDMNTDNNVMEKDVFVAAHDVALTGVVEPSGNLYEVGTWIFPAVDAANNGNVAETFDVTLEITKNGVPYTTLTSTLSLDAGATGTAVFDSVQLDEEGEYVFDYTISVPNDTCSANDEVSTSLNASYHDVGIVGIINLDEPLYHVGDNVPLAIVVANNKLFDEPNVQCVVNVTADDSLVFTRTMDMELEHNSIDTLEFTIFTVPLGGHFTVNYSVWVDHDHDSTNNNATAHFIAPELGVADTIPFFADTTGNWQFGAPSASGEPMPANGTNLWGTVLGGNYAPNADWPLYTSDWMDVNGEHPVLVFDQWYQFAAGDGGWIEIQLPNGDIVQVTPEGGYNGEINGTPAFVGESDWEQVIVDLSDILTQGDSFRLILHFHSDASEEALGWYVDNIELLDNYQRMPNDVSVTYLWAPTAAQPLYRGQLVNLWTVVRLTSNTPRSRTFRVLAKVYDNEGVLVYSASALVRNFNPGEVDTVYFSPGWIPFEVGTYRFIVTVYNLGDPNMLNNTMATNIVVQSDKGTQGAEHLPVPNIFVLAGLYPNPFSSSTAITFGVPRSAHVKVVVYDAQGRFVRTIADGEFQPGYHTVTWNGTDGSGRRLGSGIYFVRMQADGFSATKRIVLMK